VSFRVAIVGCGRIGAGEAPPEAGAQSHAAAWVAHPRARLVAVCDSARERRERARDRWGANASFEDLTSLLDRARPDIVSLCTPDATHAPLLAEILEAPGIRAVLVEKPIALDSAAARPLVARSRACGIVLAVNYGRRSLPSHRELRAWLALGGVGRVRQVTGYYVGGIKHNGTHWLDLARFLVGEVAEARGRARGIAPREDDPTIDVELEFVGGTSGTLVGVRDVTYSLFEMDLVGDAGRVRLGRGGADFEIAAVRASGWFAGKSELVPAGGPRGGLADLLRYPAADLIDALERGREPACPGEDALEALALAESAIESAAEASHVP
jgi:predicted dehydrogenase